MKTSVALLAAMLLLGRNAMGASNLDKPIEVQKPTVRSEIYRGRKAMDKCIGFINSTSAHYTPYDYFTCISKIENDNVQNRTTNAAFEAGLFFNTWLSTFYLDDILRDAHGQAIIGVLREGQAISYDEIAAQYFKKMKDRQRTLDLDNKALCEATEVRCKNLLPIMKKWETKRD